MNIEKQDFNHFFKIRKRQRYGVLLLGGMFAISTAQAQMSMTGRAAAVTMGPSAVEPAARPVAEEVEKAATPNRPGSDGVKVHGHWVIDITNPDGTLAKHLDFENSLTTGAAAGADIGSTGDQIVAALLSGSAVPSDPGISFVQAPAPGTSVPAGTDVTGLCSGGNGVAGYTCGILTTAQSLTNFYHGFALSVETGLSSTVNFRPTVSWVLSGNYTIPTSGMTSITAVQTLLPICVSNSAFLSASFDLSLQGSGAGLGQTTAPSKCTLTGYGGSQVISYGPLTQTIVPGAPQAVTPGQVIAVMVTLSFS